MVIRHVEQGKNWLRARSQSSWEVQLNRSVQLCMSEFMLREVELVRSLEGTSLGLQDATRVHESS